MTDDTVTIVVFHDGDSPQIDFKFKDEFDADNPTPVEEIAMAIFMYVSDELQGEAVEISDDT